MRLRSLLLSGQLLAKFPAEFDDLVETLSICAMVSSRGCSAYSSRNSIGIWARRPLVRIVWAGDSSRDGELKPLSDAIVIRKPRRCSRAP